MEWLRLTDDARSEGRAWDFSAGPGELRKWTVLGEAEGGTAFLAGLVLGCCGRTQALGLPASVRRAILGGRRTTGRVQCGLIRHARWERGLTQPVRRQTGWEVTPTSLRPLHLREMEAPAQDVSLGALTARQSSRGWLLLGYGRLLRPHAGTDRFEFSDVHHRLTRTASLFDPAARLTDPLAFLERLRLKGVRYGRGRSRGYLTRLSEELGALLGFGRERWLETGHDFRRDWLQWTGWQRTLAVVFLDVARHVLEATDGRSDPFAQAGVAIFDGLAPGVPARAWSACFDALDRVFPEVQFIVRLETRQQPFVSRELRSKTLAIPERAAPERAGPRPRLRPGSVLLIDVDSRLPNLALMKLARAYRNEGRRVVLGRRGRVDGHAEVVAASCVFSFPGSLRRLEGLRAHYGSELQVGGSGVDLRQRLPEAVESLEPDFSLYPELGDRAIGFLTRGCPRHCSFCVVPEKEGRPRVVADLDSVLQGRRRLILLDDNLLAHASAPEVLEAMVRRELEVNFNQTLDLRYLRPETAALLRRVQASNVRFTRRVLHFSLNDNRGLEGLRRHYGWLGTTGRDAVEFVCMYGFNTTLAQDVERFRFLRSLPGAYVFAQRYRPPLGGPEPDLRCYFDDRTDELLDALVKIVFPQNMKSLEVYYRWLCVLYARHQGRIHRGLVETLFRYNNRHRLARFVAELKAMADLRSAAFD